MIPRYFVVAEAEHEIQNPTSKEKLLLLGRRLGLGPDSHVLDIASGRGGPAVLLASEFGCTWRGIEISPDFHAVAVERATLRLAGLEGADAEGTPWVNRLMDVVRADTGLEHGVALPVWDALLRGEADDLATLAQKASAGSVTFRRGTGFGSAAPSRRSPMARH